MTAAVIVMLVCSTRAQQPVQATRDEDPVAVVGDLRIMTREVDERWKADSYVNGRMISGARPYEAFAAVIDDELARVSRR